VTVEFAEVKHVTLEDSSAGNAAVFDDAPRLILIAVLPTFFAA